MYTKNTRTFKASEALARYRVVELTTTENQVAYPAASGAKGELFVTQHAAASGESVTCIPLSAASGTIKVTSGAAVALGARVAVTGAAGKVDDSSGYSIGTALEASAGDGEELEIVPSPGGAGGLIHSEVADGTTLTNSTTETALATVTLDGASFKAGDILIVDYQGIAPSSNSTDTLTCKLKLGTEVIATTAATDIVNDDVQRIHAEITIRTAGASATLVASGYFANDADGTAPTFFAISSVTEDLSAAVALAVTGTWSVAHADNQCNSEAFSVRHIRA